jgi:hypothetical protein
MINCPKCKAELTDKDAFCFVCGYKMEPATPRQQNPEEVKVSLKPCLRCNAMPLSSEDVFCAECGNSLVQNTVNIDPITNDVQENENNQIQAEPEEFPKIVEEPVIVKDNQSAQQPEIKSEQPKPVQNEVQEKQVVQQPAQPVVPIMTQPVVPKKRKTGKIIFIILLVLIFTVVVGGGILGFLIYNGNVSRKVASQYIPSSVLDMVPSAAGTTTSATRYFVIYSFGQFDKQPVQKGKKPGVEKLAVISDIFTNLDAGTETNDGAEVVFRNEGNSQIQKFSRFTKFFVNSFSTHQEAMTEREKIIEDMKIKGYKRQFVKVAK